MRQSWDEYFMDLAFMVSTRSTCLRRHVGAVAVNADHRIIGTGYNGAPSGYPHCTPETCVRTAMHIPSGAAPHLCVAIHAEANIVLQLGEKLNGCTLYCTTQPCSGCLKSLMGCHIRRIVWAYSYPDELSKLMMEKYANSFRPLYLNLRQYDPDKGFPVPVQCFEMERVPDSERVY